MHYTESPNTIPREDRETFIRDNAVSLVEELEAKVKRQRENFTALGQTCRARGKEIKALRAALKAVLAEISGQIGDDVIIAEEVLQQCDKALAMRVDSKEPPA